MKAKISGSIIEEKEILLSEPTKAYFQAFHTDLYAGV